MTRTPVQTTQERVQELHEQLQRGVGALLNADTWKSYLRLMATAYKYSPNNALLIYLQKPDAQLVHGYRAWQRLGRQVRKGERAIHVLAPVTYRANDDGDDAPQLRGFKIASVFDIAQTQGPDLPDMRPGIVEGQAPKVLWDAMAQRVADRGYTLLVKPIEVPGLDGWTRPSTREMCINSRTPPAHRLVTLGHELAHVELDHTAEGFDYIAHRSLAEVEAESVAYILSGLAGIDSSPSSFHYLAGWSGNKPELLLQVAAKVQRVTHTVLEAMPEFSKGFSVVEVEGRGIDRGIA